MEVEAEAKEAGLADRSGKDSAVQSVDAKEHGRFSARVHNVPWSHIGRKSPFQITGVEISLENDKEAPYITASFELRGDDQESLEAKARKLWLLLENLLVVEQGFGAEVVSHGVSWRMPNGRWSIQVTFATRASVMPQGFDWLPAALSDSERVVFQERVQKHGTVRSALKHFREGEKAYFNSLYRAAMWSYSLVVEGLYLLSDDFAARQKRLKWDKMVDVLARETGYSLQLSAKEIANARLTVCHFKADNSPGCFLTSLVEARNLCRMGFRREAKRAL